MIGLRGEFHLSVHDARTGNLTKERHFHNLITDIGLRTFAQGAPGGAGMYCAVGVGTADPSVDDIDLAQRIAYTLVSEVGHTTPTAPNYEYSAAVAGRFAAGAISNTITEIGIGYSAVNGSPLFCRQRILDEQGNPSSLAVLPNEYLDVVYTLWYYPSLSDDTFSFQMNGTTYNCIARTALLPSYSQVNPRFLNSSAGFTAYRCYETQTLGDITSGPAGQAYGSNINSTGDFWGGNAEPFLWGGTILFPLANYNPPGGIGSMIIYMRGPMPATQISFSPKLPKDSNTEMSLVFTQQIGRYEP